MDTKFMKGLFRLGAAVLCCVCAYQAHAQSWEPLNTGATETVRGIWGSTPANIFIAGDSGIYNGSGSTWQHMLPGENLRSIWGFSASDIYAVGEGGMIRHYDGTSWTAMASGTTTRLNYVWGPHPERVYAVGDNGLILLYEADKAVWRQMASPTEETLWSIWGDAVLNTSGQYAYDIYVVGDNGIILYGAGWAWEEMASPTAEDLFTVWGSACNYIFAAGGNGMLMRYDCESWKIIPSGTAQDLRGIWSLNEDRVFVVGTNGIIIGYDGLWTYTVMNSGTTNNLYNIWGFAEDDLYAVGDGGSVLQYQSGGTVDPETRKLKIIPAKINQMLNRLFPFHLMLLIGEQGTSFSRDDMPVWGTESIKTLLQLQLGNRVILALVFVDPLIPCDDYAITAGDCAGMLQVKEFAAKARATTCKQKYALTH